jgi:hypothetical protein
MRSKFFELNFIEINQRIVISSEKNKIDFVTNPIHVVVNFDDRPRPEYIIDSPSYITENNLKTKTSFELISKGRDAIVLVETSADIDINKIRVFMKI